MNRNYWGKYFDDASWHHLCHHCVDVAEVFRELLRVNAVWRKELYSLSPFSPEDTESLLLFFVFVHDLGKFHTGFQCLTPLGKLLGHRTAPYEAHHTELGLGIWAELFEEPDDISVGNIPLDFCEEFAPDYALYPLVTAALAHHGSPAEAVSISRDVLSDIKDDVREFLHVAWGHYVGRSFHVPQDAECCKPLSWLFAGLVILADWIGSDDRFFSPVPEWKGIEAYLPKARESARNAVAASGIAESEIVRAGSFSGLLPHLPKDAIPSGMQQAVYSLPAPQGQELLIIEDLTGGGKTEAAILGAYRLLQGGYASGIYFALPTMATANAMYSRLHASYQALFASPDTSLVLAHGSVFLNDLYQSTIGHNSAEGEDGAAYCSQWLADNRKKALLAPCGAGTIDQALLAILGSRHQALRLAGIARSVLIIDEIHASDVYTGSLVKNLLKFHAALGGSAILLSATLPDSSRHELVASWYEGVHGDAGCLSAIAECFDPPRCSVQSGVVLNPNSFFPLDNNWSSESTASTFSESEPHSADMQGTGQSWPQFPLMTRCTVQGLYSTPVNTERSLNVEVVPVHDEAAVLSELATAHASGACACWIRNTVADVLEAYSSLVEQYAIPLEDITVFHARFTGADRAAIESMVLNRFGKQSTAEQRAGRIVIASQVVEQSLDLDFDVLCSDLAPMELMIQRAGRCHRHARPRPAGYDTPKMVVLMPKPEVDVSARWYSDLFPVAQYVYPRPALLWRTARLLCQKGRIDLPRDARELVEGAYGNAIVQAPDVLVQAEIVPEGEERAAEEAANFVNLSFRDGYCIGLTPWGPDVTAPTRLGEATRAVRLVRVIEQDGTTFLQLWADMRQQGLSVPAGKTAFYPLPQDKAEAMKLCYRSEVRIPVRKLQNASVPCDIREALEAFVQTMPDKGKWCLCLPVRLEDSDDTWRGAGEDGKEQPVSIEYTPWSGLLIDCV